MKKWAWYTLSAHAPNYVPLAVLCVRSWCDLPEEHSIAIFSSQSTRRGSKNILEAVFGVEVEADDGMQQPSSISK